MRKHAKPGIFYYGGPDSAGPTGRFPPRRKHGTFFRGFVKISESTLVTAGRTPPPPRNLLARYRALDVNRGLHFVFSCSIDAAPGITTGRPTSLLNEWAATPGTEKTAVMPRVWEGNRRRYRIHY